VCSSLKCPHSHHVSGSCLNLSHPALLLNHCRMAKNRIDGLQVAFLENSSRYLAISSPSTSAHLMTERIALSTGNERATVKGPRDNVCNACGTLMILGWNTTMRHEQKPCKSTTQIPIRKRQRRLIQVCQVCHRETATTLSVKVNAVKGGRPTPSSSSTTNKHSAEAPATVDKRAEKTSGKQRAKTRKEKGGLQALLNKSKQASASSSSLKLDLMDFMKA
jgi:ribonuclease MRP protein subunit SNM1